MFKRTMGSIALVLMFTLSFVASAGAQDLPGGVETKDIKGLKVAYTRMYAPGADEATTPAGISMTGDMMTISAAEFENDDDAKEFMKSGTEQIEKTVGQQGVDMKIEDKDDLGDEAKAIHISMKAGDTSFAMESIMFRDGKTIFNVLTMLGDAETAKKATEDVAKFIDDKDNGGDVDLKQDGTSTGGVFDRMPTKDDTDVTGGMVPTKDDEVKP